MKKIMFMAALFITGLAVAQSRYETGMQKGLDQLKEAKTAEDMMATSAFFERIAEAEKEQWLPYYYAAYANHLTGWMNPKADKDKVAEKTKDLIAKAEAISPNNAELYCLRQMCAVQQLTVDAMTRYQSYGAQAAEAIEKAKKADPNNPRIYFLEAQYMKNVPAAFGGGNAVAKKLLEKAVELYKSYQPPSAFHPNWGQSDAEKLLASVSNM